MIDRSTLEIGSLLPADRLLGQTAYLASVAVREESSLGGHGWPSWRTHDLLELAFKLKEALRLLGRDVHREDAARRHATLELAREWGQQLILYLHNTLEPDHPALRALRPPPEGWQAQRLRQWLEPLVDFAHAHELELSSWGGGVLFTDRGEELLRELRATEVPSLLPDPSTSEARAIELKAQLYLSLCRLVRCGHALWIGDPEAASSYHLRFLDLRNPVPPDLLVPGTSIIAGFRMGDLYEPAPPIASELEGDFRVETLASAPVVPMGHEDVHRIPDGWHHEPAEHREGPRAAAALQGEREHTATAKEGMATGTEWGIHPAPGAAVPERRESPKVGRGGASKG